MLKPVLAALSLFGLTACGPSTDQVDMDPRDISYFRDSATRLCFGAMSVTAAYTDTITITHVPCTEEVIALLGR